LQISIIEPSEAFKLQLNLIRSHAVTPIMSIKDFIPEEIARAILLIRTNALAKGYSGVRPCLIKKMLELLNEGVTPAIPKFGSVGASGDLAPLAYMALVLLGEGKAFYQGELLDGRTALEKARVAPLTLVEEELPFSYKEGLALINGTSFMAAFGVLNLLKLEDMMRSICSVDLEPKYIPFLNSLEEFLDFSRYILTIEINSANDNPLIFKDTALSGANFHGEPIAITLDGMGFVGATMATLLKRKIGELTNYTGSIYEGAELLAIEIQNLAQPASVDSIPTSDGQEDHVSMGANSALTLDEIVRKLEMLFEIFYSF